MSLDRHLAVRLGAAALLAAAAVTLFVFTRSAPAGPPPAALNDIRLAVPTVERTVDSILAAFDIRRQAVRRTAFSAGGLERIERRIDVSPAFPSIQLNQALNRAVTPFGGRVVASENLKERLVTLHVELGGTIVETVVLRTVTAAPARRRR